MGKLNVPRRGRRGNASGFDPLGEKNETKKNPPSSIEVLNELNSADDETRENACMTIAHILMNEDGDQNFPEQLSKLFENHLVGRLGEKLADPTSHFVRIGAAGALKNLIISCDPIIMTENLLVKSDILTPILHVITVSLENLKNLTKDAATQQQIPQPQQPEPQDQMEPEDVLQNQPHKGRGRKVDYLSQIDSSIELLALLIEVIALLCDNSAGNAIQKVTRHPTALNTLMEILNLNNLNQNLDLSDLLKRVAECFLIICDENHELITKINKMDSPSGNFITFIKFLLSSKAKNHISPYFKICLIVVLFELTQISNFVKDHFESCLEHINEVFAFDPFQNFSAIFENSLKGVPQQDPLEMFFNGPSSYKNKKADPQEVQWKENLRAKKLAFEFLSDSIVMIDDINNNYANLEEDEDIDYQLAENEDPDIPNAEEDSEAMETENNDAIQTEKQIPISSIAIEFFEKWSRIQLTPKLSVSLESVVGNENKIPLPALRAQKDEVETYLTSLLLLFNSLFTSSVPDAIFSNSNNFIISVFKLLQSPCFEKVKILVQQREKKEIDPMIVEHIELMSRIMWILLNTHSTEIPNPTQDDIKRFRQICQIQDMESNNPNEAIPLLQDIERNSVGILAGLGRKPENVTNIYFGSELHQVFKNSFPKIEKFWGEKKGPKITTQMEIVCECLDGMMDIFGGNTFDSYMKEKKILQELAPILHRMQHWEKAKGGLKSCLQPEVHERLQLAILNLTNFIAEKRKDLKL